MIPYGMHDISEQDIAAVVEVLRSDRITQGDAVLRFEQRLCEITGAAHAISTNSATSALHLACLLLGVGPGDAVWTSANTFVASANCARYCGAEVDFVDIDSDTGNLSVTALEQKLRSAKQLPKVVIPVHFAGQPCDMAAIKALADEYGFSIIEDASHALGARYRQQPVGNCQFSDITVFSFHPVKIATTGEGGALILNDSVMAQRAVELRSHGVTRDRAKIAGTAGGWYYEQQALGFNYRMTDIQAALGLSQLSRLNEFVHRRQAIAARYEAAFSQQGIESLPITPDSSVHLFVMLLKPEHRETVYNQLQARGIGVNVHYIPVYWQPYYRQRGFEPGHCPRSEDYYRRAISLPLFPALTDAQQDFVIEAVVDSISAAVSAP